MPLKKSLSQGSSTMTAHRPMFTRTSSACVLLALSLLGLVAAPPGFPASAGINIHSMALVFGELSPEPVVDHLGRNAEGWRVDRDPRLVADVDKDDRADILSFAEAGVFVSVSCSGTSERCFQTAQHPVLSDFADTESWGADRNPGIVVDLNNDDRGDIVGFADTGVLVSLSTYTAISAGFRGDQQVLNHFGYSAGGWRVDRDPRIMADVNNDGRADIVGFGDAGVLLSLPSSGLGVPSIQAPQ